MSDSGDLTTLPCRYGLITFPREDSVIGRSLHTYGEWAQSEIDLILELVPEGGTAVDAGAFVGTHTLALAQRVGPAGRVIAIEGQPAIRDLLRTNVAQNDLRQVEVVEGAVGRQRGILFFPELDLAQEHNFGHLRALETTDEAAGQPTVGVEAFPLDELLEGPVDLIKADLEGMEVPVLESAQHALESSRPHLYLECSSVSNGLRILDFLRAHDYRAFLHRAPAFNPENHFGNQTRIFGLARETNMLGIAGERMPQVEALLDQHPELAPVSDLDTLATLLLATARWGEPEWATLTKAGLIARITLLLQDQYRLERILRRQHLSQERNPDEMAVSSPAVDLVFDAPADQGANPPADDDEPAAAASLEAEQIEALRAQVASLTRCNEELAWERQRAASRWLETDRHNARLEAELVAARRQQASGLQHDGHQSVDGSPEPGGVAAAEEAPRDPGTAREHASPVAHPSAPSPHVLGGDERAHAELAAQLFDADFYRQANHDVPPDASTDELLQHFLSSGWKQLRDPHPLFDASFYVERSPDLQEVSINPLLHFMMQGAKEGRDPHPLFISAHYLAQARKVAGSGVSPLFHFLSSGHRAGYDPHPLFCTDFYLAQAPDCGDRGLDPLTHFVTEGAWEGLDPHPLFDSSFYLSRHPDLRDSGVDPLSHFLTQGALADSDPHPFFSTRFYRESVEGLGAAGVNPLMHFVAQGRDEGRMPRRIFELASHKFLVTEIDKLRHDGRPVLLILTGSGDLGLEQGLRRVAAALREECVVLYLRPADTALLGDRVQGLLALSPISEDGPGLLFDPRLQMSTLAAVVRGVGAVRVHVTEVHSEATLVSEILGHLGLPHELSLHEQRYRASHPGGAIPGARGRAGAAGAAMARRLRTFLRQRLPFGARRLPDWLHQHRWLVDEAERVLVPSEKAAARMSHRFPSSQRITVVASDPVASLHVARPEPAVVETSP